MPQNEAKFSELKKQAIDWLILLRSDEVSEDELHAFAHWLAEEHTHSEAFAAAEKLYAEMAYVARESVNVQSDNISIVASSPVNPILQPEQVTIRRKRRQRWFGSAIAMAAVWLFATLLYLPIQFYIWDTLTSDYYTQTGQVQNIKLPDGSHILLNTNSAVSLVYTHSERKVILHHGQARFTVAKDKLRPFVVDVDNFSVRALGTIFQIYKAADDKIKITVQEHAVAVRRVVGHSLFLDSKDIVAVETGQQLNIISQEVLPQPEQVSLNQATAWQQRRLIINDQPLGALIDELERYRPGRIFLADKQLQNLRVTGVFSLEDPESVLNAVIKVLELKETRLGPWWVVLHQ